MTDLSLETQPTSGDVDAAASASHSVTEQHSARNRLVITILLVSVFVMILNETIMGVALPRLMDDLNVVAGTAQWLTAAFLLTMAVVIPVTGFLLQRVNTRTLFITAMSLFSLGTLIAAVSPGFTVLLLARIVQASGTAIMFPLLMTTVMTLVPPETRGRMMGNISIVISVAPAIGPTISGLILSVLSWRFMFVIVLPIALIALIVGAKLMQNVTEPKATPIDVLSIVLSAVGFGGLVYGLSNAGTATTPLEVWLPIGGGVAALVLFVLRQTRLQKRDHALLDLRTFRTPTFSFSIVMFAVMMMAMFGTIVLLPIYMVRVLGLQELSVGLLLLPGGLIMGLLAPLVGRIYDRIGPTALLVAGSVVASGSLWFMSMMLTEDASIWAVLTAHVMLSIGLALLFTPLFTASLGSLKPDLYSHGSAIVATIQQLAGAAGTALFVTVMSAVQIAHAAEGEAASFAAGTHTAFLFGAVISLLTIPVAFFVRRTADASAVPLAH